MGLAPLTSWADFLEYAKKPEISGRVVILDSQGDTIPLALKAVGVSGNSEDLDDLQRAEDWLLEVRPHLLSINSAEYRSQLRTGDAILSMAWNGDAVGLVLGYEGDPVPVTYVLPTEGGIQWIDEWAILSVARNPNLSHAFINFMIDPQVAADDMNFTYYATANKTAVDQGLIDPELVEDATVYPVIFPTGEELARAELVGTPSADARIARNRTWTKFKAG
jgi:putrescine transport system substrate-binding protein